MGIFVSGDFTGTKWVNRIVGGSGAVYLDPQYGDDRNDGHPKRPFATWAAARAAGGINALIIVSPGTLAEQSSDQFHGELRGDSKKPVIDGTSFITYANELNDRFLSTNLHIKNFTNLYRGGASNSQAVKYRNCIIESVSAINYSNSFIDPVFEFNTVINSFQAGTTSSSLISRFHIFNKNTFINSKFMFRSDMKALNSDFDSNSELIFETTEPTTFDYLNIQGLVDGLSFNDYVTANPGSLPNSLNAPSLHNDPANGDYTLQPLSLIRHAGNDGLQIGSQGVSFSLNGQLDFSNVSNANWNGSKWVATVTTLPAVIESIVRDKGQPFPIEEIQVYGEESDIALQHIDESLAYDPVDITSGNIVQDERYLVFGYTSVTYDGEIYTTGQVFTGVLGVTTYTTVGTGSVYKIIETPDQRIIEYRGSNISAIDVGSQPYKRYIIGKGVINDSLGVSIGETGHDFDDQESPAYQYDQFRITLLPKT